MDLQVVLQTLAYSVMASGFYGIMAVGLALIFGVMHMANYAHGEFFKEISIFKNYP